MKITVLCDNESESGRYLTEHGYSLWIETKTPKGETVKILFDTGASNKFLTNASRMGVDVRGNDYTVISHGHYDHGGGLGPLLQDAPHSRIYLSSLAFDPRIKGEVGEKYYYGEKNLGISPALRKKNRDNFILIDSETVLEEGVTLLTAAPLHYPMPPNTGLCEVDKKGKLKKDLFEHEIYLAVTEGEELFLFTGCAHRGIANIARMAQEHFPRMKRYTLTGGFHIKNDPGETQINLLKDLTSTFPDRWRFISGHCSGREKVQLLEESLDSPVSYGFTGTSLSF